MLLFLYFRLVRFLHHDVLLRNRTLELDSFLSKISACQYIARPSQSKNCSFSLEGFHSHDSNVTFAFLQVS